jgi:riboflavin kinase / FMN adenylyltransferase
VDVITDLAACPAWPDGCVATIGAYDGVHVGHQRLIADVRRMAAERGAASAVVTFDRHPAMVVRPDSAPRLLTDLATKLELLAATGVDATVVVPFDAERSRETAEDFVQTVLVDGLAVRAVVVGHDFHFGYGRGGNVALLARMGGELGFDVLGVRLFGDGRSEAVSSTRIREALAAGDVPTATNLLGRWHRVRGVVGRGDARGRELGYPTANVAVPAEILLPADGIYAGWFVRADGSRHAAAVSLGLRPTFYADASASLLEAYLLDFTGDLYDETVVVEFVARLRDEIRFHGADALAELTAQMARDVEAAGEVLAQQEPPEHHEGRD